MRLLVLALVLSASISASGVPAMPANSPPEVVIPSDRTVGSGGVIDPNGPFSSVCPPTSRYEAARRGGKLPPSLLTELPGADMYNAVYRKVGGCEVPMIVRYDVGGTTSGNRR
ncbi:hypothetical protein [Sphingomonas sp. URHD0057]|uniref:hypothetical protein n=1 Tax=Sphingomonas sp. URHD0057 TaxID=1380389 RepID=UPI0012DD145F|nr:hypothetical protein [Sphingomonas sp. URHD0057]